MLSEITPRDLHLPYDSWRKIQEEAVEFCMTSRKRAIGLGMPTGSGKSLTVMAVLKLLDARGVILTSTKGLMDQYVREFDVDPTVAATTEKLTGKPVEHSLVDIRGRANYRCADHSHLNCEDGRRVRCRYEQLGQCRYQKQVLEASRSKLLITNYAYWLNIHRTKRHDEGKQALGGRIGILVLDEAHCAGEELAKFLQIHIHQKEVRDLLHTDAPETEDMKEWRKWSREQADVLEEYCHDLERDLQEKGRKAPLVQLELLRKMEGLLDRLERLARIASGNDATRWWVAEMHQGTRFGRLWTFDPIRPSAWGENSLFMGIPRVICVSATLKPKSMQLLGLPIGEIDFKEWPRQFPPNRCPVYSIPGIRMNHRTGEEEMKVWLELIDRIIDDRLDRKGIIHTVAYHRQEYILRYSRHKEHMIGNTAERDSPKAGEIVKFFKAAKAPKILVSPSFSTGFDFPGEEAEWQIISKIPFVEGRSKVMKARKAADPQYLEYLAAQDLVQAAGRIMRAENDLGETFIVDENLGWFMGRNKSLFPQWFQVRRMAKIPNPAPKLEEQVEDEVGA